MPTYRRAHVPGGSFFFTAVTAQRRRIFDSSSARTLLGDVIREFQQKKPFEVNAIVLLPDHLHAIWTLSEGDSDYSKRWGLIKAAFTKRWLAGDGTEVDVSEGKASEHRRGVWQPRFWEHSLEDEDDFERHFDYVHYNPVKHGLVECPKDWEASSFHRWVEKGVYSHDWACSQRDPEELEFDDISKTLGE